MHWKRSSDHSWQVWEDHTSHLKIRQKNIFQRIKCNFSNVFGIYIPWIPWILAISLIFILISTTQSKMREMGMKKIMFHWSSKSSRLENLHTNPIKIWKLTATWVIFQLKNKSISLHSSFHLLISFFSSPLFFF